MALPTSAEETGEAAAEEAGLQEEADGLKLFLSRSSNTGACCRLPPPAFFLH